MVAGEAGPGSALLRRNEALRIQAAEIEREHREFGACAVFLVREAGTEKPVKLGCGAFPDKRLAGDQAGNPRKIEIAWMRWTAGRPVATRLEREVRLIMGERGRILPGDWFDAAAGEIAEILEAGAAAAGAWLLDTDGLRSFYNDRITRRRRF